MSRGNLTATEAKAIEITSALWTVLLEIESEHTLHPDDIHEHRRNIHNIQNRILARNSLVIIKKPKK
jgi:hypothetical protein